MQKKSTGQSGFLKLSTLIALLFLRNNSLFHSDPVSVRDSHTAVWTGSEMTVWGGFGGVSVYLDTGEDTIRAQMAV
jgi:hypothetical protein